MNIAAQTLRTLLPTLRANGNLFACLTCFWAFHFVVLWSSAFIPQNPTTNLDLSSDLIWIVAVSCNACALAIFLVGISKIKNLSYQHFSLISCFITACGIALIATRVTQSGLFWDMTYLFGIVMLGIGSGFIMSCLAELLSAVQPQTTFMGTTVSFACGALLCLIITIALVPMAIWIVTVLLPLATAVFYVKALRTPNEMPAAPLLQHTTDEAFTPGAFLLLVAIIGVTAGIMRDTSQMPASVIMDDHMFAIVVFITGLVLFALSSSMSKVRPTLLLQVVVIVIAGAFITLALMAREAPLIAFVIHTSGFVCFVALVWFFCTYFARKNGSGARGFSAGLLANQAGQAFGSLGYVGASIAFGSNDSLLLYISMGMVYLLFVVALLFFANLSRLKRNIPSVAPTTEYAEALSVMQKQRDLTPREAEIALLIVQGHSRSNIAQQLTVSQETIKTHTKHLYQKLEVHSRDELIELLHQEMQRSLPL